jgi:hypothetical protein
MHFLKAEYDLHLGLRLQAFHFQAQLPVEEVLGSLCCEKPAAAL